MTLSEWIDMHTQPHAKATRSAIYHEISEASGVSVQTISSVDRGMRLKNYDRAKAISDATDGAVTVKELCE